MNPMYQQIGTREHLVTASLRGSRIAFVALSLHRFRWLAGATLDPSIPRSLDPFL